ncbi:MAG TPA: hypothetical protein DCL42_09205 [Deltaproteobacteria bacterium]|nr:hypothetical protein [Deltaproteobacteria bacterium]
MKITFHGHACFIIESRNHKIIIDPFLKGYLTKGVVLGVGESVEI